MSVGGNDDEKVVEGDETKAVLEDLACDPRVAASFWLCVVIWLRQSQVQQSEKRADEGSRLRRVRLVTGDGDGDLEAKSEKSKERPASASGKQKSMYGHMSFDFRNALLAVGAGAQLVSLHNLINPRDFVLYTFPA